MIDGREKSSVNKVRGLGVGKGVMSMLEYFLLTGGVEFLESSLFFSVRISNLFFILFLLCSWHNKLWPIAIDTDQIAIYQEPTTNQKPTTTFWDPIIYIPSEKSPEFQTSYTNWSYLQVAKSHLFQSMRRILVNCCGQSEAAPYPVMGIKIKIFLSYSVF